MTRVERTVSKLFIIIAIHYEHYKCSLTVLVWNKIFYIIKFKQKLVSEILLNKVYQNKYLKLFMLYSHKTTEIIQQLVF